MIFARLPWRGRSSAETGAIWRNAGISDGLCQAAPAAPVAAAGEHGVPCPRPSLMQTRWRCSWWTRRRGCSTACGALSTRCAAVPSTQLVAAGRMRGGRELRRGRQKEAAQTAIRISWPGHPSSTSPGFPGLPAQCCQAACWPRWHCHLCVVSLGSTQPAGLRPRPAAPPCAGDACWLRRRGGLQTAAHHAPLAPGSRGRTADEAGPPVQAAAEGSCRLGELLFVVVRHSRLEGFEGGGMHCRSGVSASANIRAGARSSPPGSGCHHHEGVC